MSNYQESLTDSNTFPVGAKKQKATEWRLVDKILIIVGLFFINFVTAMDTTAIATVQPRVLSDFNAMTKAGAISVVQYLLSTGFRPVFAKISVVFGHLEALVLSVTLHTLGAFICAMAHSFSDIFAGSVISGLGQSGYGTAVSIIIADILPIHMRGSITAYVSVPCVTNYYIGIELANGLYNQWHLLFGILGILAVVCSIPALVSLIRLRWRAHRVLNKPESINNSIANIPLSCRFVSTAMELDIPGLILLCGGLIATLAPLGLQLNRKYGWGSVQLITPLVVGVLTLTAFVYYELHLATHPVVPFRLLKVRTFTCAILTALLYFFTVNVSLYFFTAYIQVTRNASARTAMLLQQGTTGYYVGLFIGGWAIQATKRYRRWVWLGWSLSLVAVCLMLRSRSASGVSNVEIAAVQALSGVGGGIIVGCSGIGVQASVAKPDLPIAITLYSMAKYIGGVLGEAVSTTIWVNLLPTKLDGRMNASFDIDSAINNINYFMELPKDQRTIVQDGYIATQKILIICSICSISLAAIAMLGLAPYDLSVASDQDEETKNIVESE